MRSGTSRVVGGPAVGGPACRRVRVKRGRRPGSVSCVDQPLACRLDAASARDQLREWRKLLGGGGTTNERLTPHELFVYLDPSVLADVVDLAQREKACCPFFDFSLRIDADALVLRIAVPPESSVVLDRFVGSTT
jgi:MerR family transcriptional regulator, copper efflux regulator